MSSIKENVKTGHAAISAPPDTNSYVPIVIGPGTSARRGHKPKVSGDPVTLTLQIWSGDNGFNGDASFEIQFFGLLEDAHGNMSLDDNLRQIPLTNPSGGNNRKQLLSIKGQTKTIVSVYVVPDNNEVEVMAVARPTVGGGSGNVGVYIFPIT